MDGTRFDTWTRALASSRSGRAASQTRRPGKLTLEPEAALCALAGSKSLRSLAAEMGVSHQTVRAVPRHRNRSPCAL